MGNQIYVGCAVRECKYNDLGQFPRCGKEGEIRVRMTLGGQPVCMAYRRRKDSVSPHIHEKQVEGVGDRPQPIQPPSTIPVPLTECEKFCLIKVKEGLDTDGILKAAQGLFTADYVIASILNLEHEKIIHPMALMLGRSIKGDGR